MSDLTPDKVTPYKGLVPYAEQDAPFFFGREREQAIITANLMAARLTVLYGPSGAGKSSVLRAGVEHTLREYAQRNLQERGAPELAVVVFNNWRDDPVAGLSLAVEESVKQTLTAMNPADESSPVPHDLVQNLEAWTKRLKGELLIILDQFEEYFLYHAQEDGEGTFAAEFPRAVNQPGLRVNFLVVLREDALSKLDRFKGHIPNLFDNYLRIAHLTREAAHDAIEKPLDEYNRRQTNEAERVTIEPALMEAVLSQVQTGRVTLAREGSASVGDGRQPGDATIETSYLQLVMTRLWDEEMQAGSRTLQLATLNRLEGAEHIVRTHLDSVMAGLSSDESDIAAEVFRYLVTPSGTKIAYTAKDLVAYTNTSGAQLTPVLESLAGSGLRILRTVDPPPDQPRETRYEIFHDVLAPAILDWRARYMLEKEKRELEQRLAEEAEKQRASELEAARQRELEAEARASRRLRRLVAALVVVSLIAVMAAVLAVIGWNQTESARSQAESANQSVVAQLDAVNQSFPQLVQASGEQAASAQTTAQAASVQAVSLSLQATADAGHPVPAATATAQAAAVQAAAMLAVAARATAQAAAAQATALAACAQLVRAVPSQPSVVAVPEVVSGGTLVTLQGINMQPNDRVIFYLRDPSRPSEPILQIGTTQTSAAGSFIWSFTYPSDSHWTSIPSASVIVQSTATGDYLTVLLRVVPSGTVPLVVGPTTVIFPTVTQTPDPDAWRGEYYNNPNLQGQPVMVRNDPSVNFDWGHGSPAPNIPVDYFSVRWTRSLTFDGGMYRFSVRVDDGVRVWLDSQIVIDEWHPVTPNTYLKDINVAAGQHVVRVEYYEGVGIALINFNFDRVTAYPDWKGDYYNNQFLSGSPTYTRNDVAVSFDWSTTAPAPGVPTNNFSVRWTRSVEFTPGTYRFTIRVNGGTNFLIDGDLVIGQWNNNVNGTFTADYTLSSGTHSFEIDYYNISGNANIWFTYQPITGSSTDWSGNYFANDHWSGVPTMVRFDPTINFDWGTGSPAPLIPIDFFSVRWTRSMQLSAGQYQFDFTMDDGVRFYIDNQLVLDQVKESAEVNYTLQLNLPQGNHEFRIEYVEYTGAALIEFSITPLNVSGTPTPAGN